MKRATSVLFLLVFTLGMFSCTENNQKLFDEIYGLVYEKDFFNAYNAYNAFEQNKSELSDFQQEYLTAVLMNAFNYIDESEKAVDMLLQNESSLPDSLLLNLYELKKDNSSKTFRYKDAAEAAKKITENFRSLLDSTELEDQKNDFVLWSALQDVPPQEVLVKHTTNIKMKLDKAGLNNLETHCNGDTVGFIFDTGAGLSTIIESVAERYGMQIIPSEIKVGTVTGEHIYAQLAVCDTLMMDDIEWHNVVFLVLPDEALSFPSADYQIFGVLGFPAIEALENITISTSGDFIVSVGQTSTPHTRNMALDNLVPMICIDGHHYTFDTGAQGTLLYQKYYLENQQSIDSAYSLTSIGFGGAGGTKDFEGYEIDLPLSIGNHHVVLEDVHVLKDKIEDNNFAYGNIGQDLIKKFDKMTLNFKEMYIDFE